MLLLKLAVLNIGRNPRRSVITVIAVAVGLASLIFLWGFSDGTTEQQRENAIRLFTGHVQIHATGFEKTLSPELTLPNREKLLTLIKQPADFVYFSERVKCEALIGTSENSRGILLMGIDPQKETQITQLDQHMLEGEFLATEDNRSVLLGDRLATRINVEIGDKVVVMTQAMDGTLAGYSYRVQGIFHTGSQQVDELAAYITLSSAQELLDIGDDSHELVIRVTERKAIPKYLEALTPSLEANQYEILPWDKIVPEVEQWVKWSDGVIQTILITVMFVIGVGIMNTVLMSVFERTKELGVMMAIGTSPTQVILLIFFETLFLEFIGIVFGLIGGYLITFYFGQVGLTFAGVEEAFSTTFMSTTVYTRVETAHVIESVITLILLTSFIGLYPAWKAAKMEPVKAIYHT